MDRKELRRQREIEKWEREKAKPKKQGYLQLIPSVHKTDGFFISKYVKNI